MKLSDTAQNTSLPLVKVWPTLQPFVQSIVACRNFPKLAHKFYGPYLLTRRVGTVA
jgi:hypothetical protein